MLTTNFQSGIYIFRTPAPELRKLFMKQLLNVSFNIKSFKSRKYNFIYSSFIKNNIKSKRHSADLNY